MQIQYLIRVSIEWNLRMVKSELTVNVIAEWMYASCDDDGNKHLLVDSLVDYWKNDKAMTIADQKIVVRGRSSM